MLLGLRHTLPLHLLGWLGFTVASSNVFYSCIYLFFLIIYVFINLFILKHSREFDKILSNSFRFFNQNRAASLAPGIFLLCCILYFSSVSKVTLKDCFFYSFGGEFLFIFLARKSKSWCRFEQEFKLLERHWKWMSQTQSHCPRFVYLFVYLFIKKKKLAFSGVRAALMPLPSIQNGGPSWERGPNIWQQSAWGGPHRLSVIRSFGLMKPRLQPDCCGGGKKRSGVVEPRSSWWSETSHIIC